MPNKSNAFQRVQGSERRIDLRPCMRFLRAFLHRIALGTFPTKFEKGRDNMNLFYDDEGIIGKAEKAYLRNTLEEFFQLVKRMKNQLGKQG